MAGRSLQTNGCSSDPFSAPDEFRESPRDRFYTQLGPGFEPLLLVCTARRGDDDITPSSMKTSTYG